MNEMARQTKTAVDVFNPNFFTTLVDFVTEFIALIVENVMGATGRNVKTHQRNNRPTLFCSFRRFTGHIEKTRGQKEGEAQGGAGGGGAQAEGVHQGRGGRHHLPRLRPLQELQQVIHDFLMQCWIFMSSILSAAGSWQPRRIRSGRR